MCGIAGIINKQGQRVDDGLLAAFSRTLEHRGPDGEGRHVSSLGNAGFVHRRLAIIDLKTGAQPIFNEDKSLMIIFNGEIYNFVELREGLAKKGHAFRTRSDTEVVIHAYEEWGVDCLPKFNGMFCFAIWSEKTQELLLARDRLGIKVVYYYDDPDKFIFASEIKAILQHGEVPRRLNERTLIDFMTFQNTIDEKTFFEGVNKLPPAHYLRINNGRITSHEYWKPEFNYVRYGSVNDYVEEFRSIFQRSVERHLISDVPVGSYLSGGFDSSSVAKLASGLLKRQISTFTGAFAEGAEYDERPCARALCDSINGDYNETVITADQYLDNISKVVHALDEPTLGTGAFPQYMVAKLVSKKVKVVLTGHGGDELFAGYPVYKAAYLKDEYARSPIQALIKFPFNFSLSEIPRGWYFLFAHLFYPEVKQGLFSMFTARQKSGLFTDDFMNRNKDYDPLDNLISKHLKGKSDNNYERVFRLYLKTYLPTLFVQEDKVSMAHSVEARTPICDNEMLDFALKTPLSIKLFDRKLKYLVKTSMKDILPPIIYRQKKKGFPTPFAKWFKYDLKYHSRSQLLSDKIAERNIFNIKYLRKLLNCHNASSTENIVAYTRANKIHSLLMTELWGQQFLDSKTRI